MTKREVLNLGRQIHDQDIAKSAYNLGVEEERNRIVAMIKNHPLPPGLIEGSNCDDNYKQGMNDFRGEILEKLEE